LELRIEQIAEAPPDRRHRRPRRPGHRRLAAPTGSPRLGAEEQPPGPFVEDAHQHLVAIPDGVLVDHQQSIVGTRQNVKLLPDGA
jgi:hypothetical protein